MTRRKKPEAVLSAKEAAFVVALLDGADCLTAAKAAGISERTARDWQHRPAVRKAIQDGRRQVVDAATTRLASLSSKAHAVMEKMLDLDYQPTPPIPWGVRTGAVKMVHEFMQQGLGTADLSARLARFERIVAGKAAPGELEGDSPDRGEFLAEAAQ